MSSDSGSGQLPASVTPTSHPLVALFTIGAPSNTTVEVEFGTDTTYGRNTSPLPAPPGGGQLSILVAGMKASTTYHMRARIRFSDGKWITTQDQTFPTGALPSGVLPTITASTVPGQTPSPGVELVNVIDPVGVSVVADFEANVLWYYDNSADENWGGNVVPLANGDIEICASEPVPIGAPPPTSDTPSHVVELTNSPSGPQAVWRMTVTSGGAYRSYRIPSLYPGVIWTGE